MAQSALRNLPFERMNARRQRAGMEPLTQEQIAARRLSGNPLSQFVSLDTPEDMGFGATVADIGMGFLPGVGTAQGMRDFERARRDDDMLGMALGGLSAIPFAGGVVKAGRAAGKAAAAVKLGGRSVPVRMNPLDQMRGMQMVEVNTPAFEEAFRKNDSFYVGPQGAGGITGRYDRFGDFQRTANYVDVPNVSINSSGGVMFGDGRHRYAYMRDQGLPAIPMAMDADSLENARRFGYLAPSESLSALDMSQAARMQRAADQNFNETVLYHATSNDFPAFAKSRMGSSSSIGSPQKAVWLTTDPDVADTYLPGQFVNRANVPDTRDMGDGVGRYYSQGSNIMPVRVSIEPETTRWWDMGGARYNEAEVNQMLKDAKESGMKAVVFKNIRDEGLMGLGRGKRANTVAVFDPSNIRSVNAAFDPAKRNSSNLMAGVMGGAVGLSALRQLMPQQEQE